MNIIEYDKQKFINNIVAKIQPFEEERKKNYSNCYGGK